MHYNPNKRPSIEEVFKHPWVYDTCSEIEKNIFFEIEKKLNSSEWETVFNLKPKKLDAFSVITLTFGNLISRLFNKSTDGLSARDLYKKLQTPYKKNEEHII